MYGHAADHPKHVEPRRQEDAGQHVVGGFSDLGDGCRCSRLCFVTARVGRQNNFMGAGSAVHEGNRTPISAGAYVWPLNSACRCVAPGRCVVGVRRRFALQDAFRCDRRGLGRTCYRQSYGDQASCDAGRNVGCALLADPPGHGTGSQCRARPLAGDFPTVDRASSRSAGARQSPLACRAFPIPPRPPRRMGGNP